MIWTVLNKNVTFAVRCTLMSSVTSGRGSCSHVFCCPAPLQMERTCGADLMFHPRTQQCDWPAAVVAVRPECGADTPPTTTAGPAVHCDPDRPNRQHPTDCHAYYQCIRPANGLLDEVSNTAAGPPQTAAAAAVLVRSQPELEAGQVRRASVFHTLHTYEIRGIVDISKYFHILINSYCLLGITFHCDIKNDHFPTFLSFIFLLPINYYKKAICMRNVYGIFSSANHVRLRW